MKKNLLNTYLKACLGVLLFSTITLSSCGSDDDDNTPKGGGPVEVKGLLPTKIEGELFRTNSMGRFVGPVSFSYDDQNRLTSIKAEQNPDASVIDNRNYTFTYDRNGDVSSIMEETSRPNSHYKREFLFHKDGNTIYWDEWIDRYADGTEIDRNTASYTIDTNASGWVLSTYDFNSAFPYHTIYTYNSDGNMTKEVLNDDVITRNYEYNNDGYSIFKNVKTPSWVLVFIFEELMPERASYLTKMSSKTGGIPVSYTSYTGAPAEVIFNDSKFPTHIADPAYFDTDNEGNLTPAADFEGLTITYKESK